VNSPGECQYGVFLEPAYDPVRREVIYRQSASSPRLTANTAYEITAYAALDATSFGFRSFDGAPLAEITRFELNVQDDGGHPAPYDVPSTADHFCAAPAPGTRGVRDILGPNGCGYSPCHGGSTPPEGLNLGSVAGLQATAIGQSAHGAQEGENGRIPDETPSRFGRAMPIIDRGVPGNSYLVYKLLANPHTKLAVPFPAGDAGAVPPEVKRIQDSIIAGMPMPPSNGWTAALREGEAEWIADWILQGAPTTCP
jgi:hypothetical protein